MNSSFKALAAVTLMGVGLVACDETVDNTISDDAVFEPVSDLAAMREGVPENDTIPVDNKFDQTFPETFDIVATQSPVRSQGGRGVCSIFATTALMENAYIVEGSSTDWDFSEQFLQWSSKVEAGHFQNTDGSNGGANMEAISRHGIVLEEAWPYESRAWGTSNDPACTGDDQPTRCYTNGDPSAETLASPRYSLPGNRWVNCGTDSVKAAMMASGIAVGTGLDFFYQAWSHGGSELQTNRTYRNNGWVLAPTEADIADSEQRPAGHGFILVGWDDNLSVQELDAEGNPAVDADGNPIMQTGFFLFKNSWGTGWATNNPMGDGYGWIAYDYVAEYGRCYTSAQPDPHNFAAEACDNGADDDFNGQIDCEDAACEWSIACNPGGLGYETEVNAEIPDNTASGVSSTIMVDHPGALEWAYVTVDATHSYRGDLVVTLTAPNGETRTLHNREGGSANDLHGAYTIRDLTVDVAGEWTLTVADTARGDTGRFVEWSAHFFVDGGTVAEVCDDGLDNDGNNFTDCEDDACLADEACQNLDSLHVDGDEGVEIPDNTPEGVSTTIEITADGVVEELGVNVDITHPYVGDLKLVLTGPTGEVVVLRDQEGGGQDDLVTSYSPAEFIGLPAAGAWTLTISDNANIDAGTLNAWSIDLLVGEAEVCEGPDCDPEPEPEPTGEDLILSEVYYDAPGDDNGYEWIELYNPTGAAIDLSGYGIGRGGASYTTATDQLTGTIPAGGCFLIGGPNLGGITPNQLLDFNPDLQNSGSQADAIGLFALTADNIMSTSVPVDAVIYGRTNPGFVDQSGATVTPHVGDAGAGSSIARTLDGWIIASVPTPGDCTSVE